MSFRSSWRSRLILYLIVGILLVLFLSGDVSASINSSNDCRELFLVVNLENYSLLPVLVPAKDGVIDRLVDQSGSEHRLPVSMPSPSKFNIIDASVVLPFASKSFRVSVSEKTYTELHEAGATGPYTAHVRFRHEFVPKVSRTNTFEFPECPHHRSL
jgi:hypothetical protein